MKEKEIEKEIARYLRSKWAMIEWMQWWSVYIKKWKMTYKMTLQSDWCPDIICFYIWSFIWIEVKKNQKEIDEWIKIEKRFNWEWKTLPEPYFNKKWELCDTYQREKDQIRYKQKILKNWWVFILTFEPKEVIWFIEWLDKQSKKDLQSEEKEIQ